MADILIRGMKMPKYGCDNCFLRTGNYCSRIEHDESVVKYARKSERHPDCPLIEIPPHGDLIDRDKLFPIYADLLDGGDVKAVIPRICIDLAHVIIPAESEDANDKNSCML